MNWQAFLSISIIFESFGRITQRLIMREKESDPIAPAILYELIAGIILGIFSFTTGFTVPDLQPLIPYLLIAPVLWGFTNIFILKSLKTTEASVFTILFSSRTLFIILLSILLLGESFSARQAIGALLILSAVILVSWKRQKISLQKGEIFALLGAVTIAVALINDNYIVRSLPVIPYLAYNFFFSGLFILLINPGSAKRVVEISRDTKVLKKVILLACFFAISAATAVLAYQVGRNSAQLGAIFPVSNVLIVLLAIVILKEKSQLLLKIASAILCFIGVLLVA